VESAVLVDDELGFGRVTVQGMQMQLEPAVKG